ncbi:hypothetical protein AWZ03_005409 [Drosophila navojoa]|uniref:Uncharacterized protein n=1 Tax=Drosophila navojoa TaxID=7232 RepID=A0A484BHT0_DRONA|nr:hypothetical protein AWZ03_005409 [Drosophila navojoa]
MEKLKLKLKLELEQKLKLRPRLTEVFGWLLRFLAGSGHESCWSTIYSFSFVCLVFCHASYVLLEKCKQLWALGQVQGVHCTQQQQPQQQQQQQQQEQEQQQQL